MLHMLNARSSFANILFMFIALAGCGHSESPAPGDDRQYFTGDLTERLGEIYGTSGGNFDETCDMSSKEKRYEIARALQKHKREIDGSEESTVARRSAHFTKMGVFQTFTIDETNPDDKWELDHFGWPLVSEKFDQVRRQDSPRGWASLNSAFRFLITYDYARIVEWRNYSLRRADFDKIEILKSSVERCAVTLCTHLDLDDSTLAWANSIPFYRTHLAVVENFHTLEAFEQFLDRLKGDEEDYVERRNHRIRIEAPNTLIVPMSEKLVTPDQTVFENITASAWSMFGLKVKIEWHPIDDDNFTTLEILPNGSRSWGSPRHIRLPATIKASVIAHEFGHVLGLRDQYYDYFNSDTCLYDEEYNEGELMSNSFHGYVTKADIKSLESLYGLAPEKKSNE